jgi:hypothetical protein
VPEVLEETDQQRRLRVTRPDTATLDKNSGLVRLPACVSRDLLWHNLNVEAPSTDLVALHTALTYWHIAAKLQGGAKPRAPHGVGGGLADLSPGVLEPLRRQLGIANRWLSPQPDGTRWPEGWGWGPGWPAASGIHKV